MFYKSSEIRAAMLLLALVGGTSAQAPTQAPKGKDTPAPQLPFIDKKLCPGEGCVYREWKALKDVPTYDTWVGGPRKTGDIRKGETVTALSGLVITHRPGVIHIDRDLASVGLNRGDTILTYTYLGEGFSKVWFNGSFYEDFDISFTKWPNGGGCGGAHCAATYLDLGKKVWWVEVRLKSGAVKWVEAYGTAFSGMSWIGA